MTLAVRMLVYGVAANAVDDYVRIEESTTIESLKHFCNSIVEIFGPEYFRSPSPTDIARLLAIGEVRGFPVASYDLWIWHAFFGMPRSHNDLNVLDRSPLFSDLAQGKAPPTNFTVNGHTYNMGYYLANGIYPPWATLVQTISSLQGAMKQHFSMMQESAKKDAEQTSIILHNMIVEDERDSYLDLDYEISSSISVVVLSTASNNASELFISCHLGIRDKNTYHALRNDLIEHM
ncbi:uncharacterized protein LOC114257727 [Camellia sinensis]|uniref:uncharacterized protein LOC114257727 n=1 Tax=Camellia sinensis TaxID=4442 RepID=UPI0010368D04|nr:uncharacterized protein LOC114257727 [Camellia sinensis]